MENTKDEIREFLVLGEEEGDRLDVYLSSQLGEMSRSYIQKIVSANFLYAGIHMLFTISSLFSFTS